MIFPISLSACIPVEINYSYDSEFVILQNLLSFADGLNLYIAPLFFNPRDVSINNNELVILTDRIRLENSINQNNKKSDQIIAISTSIFLSGAGFWAASGNNIVLTSNDVQPYNQFTLFFNSISDTVEIAFGQQFVTFNSANNTFALEDQVIVDLGGISSQSFNYILDNGNIVLFTNFSFLSTQFTMVFNTISNTLSGGPAMLPGGILPIHSLFVLRDYPVNLSQDNYQYGQSNWVQYDTSKSVLNIAKTTNDIEQNILVTAPFKSLSVGNQLNVDVTGLKNFLTPDHYINFDTEGDVNQRNYYKLITGTNQEKGHENIFIAYEGTTQGLTLKKDESTYFHYPTTSQSIGINSTTLALNGSVASDTPFKADKIFKKNANYNKYSNWGNALPIYQQNGVWLCTWLSGNDDPGIVPVWIDRYLNPAVTNVFSLSSIDNIVDLLLGTDNGAFISTDDNKEIQINSSNFVQVLFNNFQQAYIDTPSQLTFDPGCLYAYHHIGETDNTNIVSQLSGDSKTYFLSSGVLIKEVVPGADQLLYFSDWVPNVTLDSSSHQNNLNIINTGIISNDDNLVFNTFSTNVSSFGITQSVVPFIAPDGITLSFNLYANDWSNLYGDQIVGNYFDGGVGLFINNKILTPWFYAYEKTQGRLLELNSDYLILQESKLSNISSISAVAFIFRQDYDQEYYVIDSGKNILKYDSSNILVSAISLSATVTGTLVDAVIDGLNNIYVLDTNGIYKVNLDTAAINLQFVSAFATKLVIDINGTVSILNSPFIDYCIDSQNNIFSVTPTGLYKNNILAISGTNIQKINCDQYDNIWIIHDNKLSKLTNIPYNISTSILPSSGTMSMCFNFNLKGNNFDEEYITIIDETNNLITNLSLNNTITSTQSISALSGEFIITGGMNFRLPKGDPSGYDYQRLYARRILSQNGINAKIYTQHITTSQSKIFKVQADTSTLTRGWHHFAVTFSTIYGAANLYIDGNLVNQSSSNINPYQHSFTAANYRNEQRFIVGSSSSKNGSLNEKIKQSNSYIFAGRYNEIRLYDKSLTSNEIKYIARNGYINTYDDMIWNMPIGTNQYLEEIEKFFKHRMPGNKSQFFNLKIRGYKPTTSDLQTFFESNIRQVITKIIPAHTELKDIIWVDTNS